MKRLALVLAAAVFVGCSSDVRLLRQTSAVYASAVARFDRKCVNVEVKGPPECPKTEAELMATREEIAAYLHAFLLGPLPESARKRLEQIQVESEALPK